jgi:UDP-N-acetylglucosamine 2-epimerase (non-hydrolysing)
MNEPFCQRKPRGTTRHQTAQPRNVANEPHLFTRGTISTPRYPILSAVRDVVHVVGARPNFMKAVPVIRAIQARRLPQRLIHTGQHYDASLSDVFFRELGLPLPDLNLGVGSGSHGAQTAALMIALESAFQSLDPSLVVIYGDVNSTCAAALVASKLQISTAHVEAGLRSFDNTMPEEINRKVADLLSDLLFVTAPEGVTNLVSEGAIRDRIHFVGNPMIDTLLDNLDRFNPGPARQRYGLSEPYAVATIHRPSNVDDPAAARQIVKMLIGLTRELQVILPLHPRGRQSLKQAGLEPGANLIVVDPMGYLDFMSLVRGASVVVTDSGGIQEETTTLGVPCLTVRKNTERPITISHGTNTLAEPDDVPRMTAAILERGSRPSPDPPPLWDGHAGQRIAAIIDSWLQELQGPSGLQSAK